MPGLASVGLGNARPYRHRIGNDEHFRLLRHGILNFPMTYEIPLAVKTDVSDTDLKNPDGSCGPGGSIAPGEGLSPIPIGGFEGDCEETGVGDMNLRFMVSTDWDALGGDWLLGVELDFPTATDDLLGSEQFTIAPISHSGSDPNSARVIQPGSIVYLKPGWGVDPDEDEGDREFIFEVGWRYFMD